MANQDAPFGLRAVKMIGGAPFPGGQSRYRIAAAYGTKIHTGDLVKQVTGGTIERHANGDTVPLVGVFNGCTFTNADGETVFSQFYPAGSETDIIAFVIDNPLVVFEAQADAAVPVTDLFGNFDLTMTAGDDNTGQSKAVINVTSGATDSDHPVKVFDISEDPSNSDITAANVNVLCTIQNHVYGVKAAGLA
jgi:hypothetical protein